MSKIKNADMPANPIAHKGSPSLHAYVVDTEGLCTGLSKREQIAMTALQGILASEYYMDFCGDYGSGEDRNNVASAKAAVAHADALLDELGKE